MYGYVGLFPFLFLNVKCSRGGPHCRDLLEKKGTVQKGGFTQAKAQKEKEQQMQAQGELQS
jgi:hypothetical protein